MTQACSHTPMIRMPPRQLLENDGWVDTNNDGIREKDTRSLSLSIQYDANNKAYEQIADIVQDQLNSVGFDITFAPVDSAALVQALLGQTFDMVVSGWAALGAESKRRRFLVCDSRSSRQRL